MARNDSWRLRNGTLHPRDVKALAKFLAGQDELSLLTAKEERDLLLVVEKNKLVKRQLLELEKILEKNPHSRHSLAKKWAKWKAARDTLIQRNLRLVGSLARAFSNRTSAIEFIDLLQEGVCALARAIDKFELSRGSRLSTYVSWWISRDVQMETILASGKKVHETRMMTELIRVQQALWEQLGRKPSVEEIAKQVGMDVVDVLGFLSLERPIVSLNKPGAGDLDDSDGQLQDFIAAVNDPGPTDQVECDSLREFVLSRLERLYPREREVIKMRFGFNGHEEMTLKQIGLLLGISKERVRQIQAKALKKMIRDKSLVRALKGID